MRKYKYTIIICIAAALYWAAEALLHIFVFSDPESGFFPTDINELWMRSAIVVLMILFGIYADIQTRNLLAKEEEKRDVFVATVSSTQHILNNLLNQLQLALVDTDETGALDEETRKLLKQALVEGKEQVIRLSSVTDLEGAAIRKSIET
jgi:hypothetical protein